MQLITNTDPSEATTSDEPVESVDSDYVGRHRPTKMSLRHPRLRVSQLANRQVAAPAK